MSEKVLITGGLGFIGLALARNLVARGMAVRLVDNLSPQIHGALPRIDLGDLESALADGRVQVVRADVCNRADWTATLEGVGSVVHLAAETGTGQSMYQIETYTRTNVLGTALLLDVLANSAHRVKKVVLGSSRAVYGEGAYRCERCGVVSPAARTEADLHAARWEPVCPTCAGKLTCVATPESTRTAPASIYAATKLAQEDLVRIAATSLGIPFQIFRFQNVYGEGQSLNNPYTGILSIFSNRIRRNRPVYLFEDGQESRDFVHVSDVAEAVARGLLSAAADGLCMNVGNGQPTSIETLTRTLKRHLGDNTEALVSGQFRLGDIRHCYADLTLIRRALGFEPQVSLEEGVARFVQWVRAQPLADDGLDHANRELADRGLMKV